MSPAERQLLEAIARAIATSPGRSSGCTNMDLVDALEAMKREAETVCGVVGYPGGIRRQCELARDAPHDYHQDGSVRWVGYFREADDIGREFRTP